MKPLVIIARMRYRTVMYRDNLQVTTWCLKSPFTVNLQQFLSHIYEHYPWQSVCMLSYNHSSLAAEHVPTEHNNKKLMFLKKIITL